jgi:hypothetical protein
LGVAFRRRRDLPPCSLTTWVSVSAARHRAPVPPVPSAHWLGSAIGLFFISHRNRTQSWVDSVATSYFEGWRERERERERRRDGRFIDVMCIVD